MSAGRRQGSVNLLAYRYVAKDSQRDASPSMTTAGE